MSDLLHRSLKWIDYNRYIALAFVILLGSVLWVTSCEPKTVSPLTGEKVEASVFDTHAIEVRNKLAKRSADLDAQLSAFNADVDAANSVIEVGMADLQDQYAKRKALLESGGELALGLITGTVNPASIVGSIVMAGSLLLGGLSWKNGKRKDAIIANLKKPTNKGEDDPTSPT